MKLRTWTISGLVGCLLYAVPLSAQPSLPNDFALGTDSIILPEYLRADAGYPAWRIVTMEGKQAVPYTYCAWLLATQPWTQPLFGPNAWQAEKNCADGITAVSRLNLDQSVPRVGNDSQFWRQRPVGYQYMVPDSTLSQAEFDSLMPPASGATVKFVENPRQLADFMADVTERLSALEEWRQSLNDSGGAVTQDSLRTWLLENKYIQQSDLPNVSEFLTQQQIEDLIDGKVPDTSNFLTKTDAEDFVSKGDVPDTSNFLTKSQTDDLYQEKGVEVPQGFWGSILWYLVLLLPLLLLCAILIMLWRRNKKQAPPGTLVLKDNQLDFSQMHERADKQQKEIESAHKKADSALQRIDEVRSGLEAVIEIEAMDRLKAPGFTNETLRNLGDKPFVLTMPGPGVARKQVHIFNHGDYIELFGLEPGHDRVDKIDMIAVLKHLAKARRPENQWIEGITARRAA